MQVTQENQFHFFIVIGKVLDLDLLIVAVNEWYLLCDRLKEGKVRKSLDSEFKYLLSICSWIHPATFLVQLPIVYIFTQPAVKPVSTTY